MDSKWSQNSYVLGCWTDPVIGTDSSMFANMAGRVENLFFAGEAAHADWYGFIQGGYYWSGRMTLLVLFKAGSANLMSPPQAYQ